MKNNVPVMKGRTEMGALQPRSRDVVEYANGAIDYSTNDVGRTALVVHL